jgi:hypothetical protein
MELARLPQIQNIGNHVFPGVYPFIPSDRHSDPRTLCFETSKIRIFKDKSFAPAQHFNFVYNLIMVRLHVDCA